MRTTTEEQIESETSRDFRKVYNGVVQYVVYDVRCSRLRPQSCTLQVNAGGKGVSGSGDWVILLVYYLLYMFVCVLV
jgi:hypothetical protein